MDAKAILDREFLAIRARLLDVAAAFDRIDRADGNADQDPRLQTLLEALQIAAGDDPQRARRIQLLFSRAYDENWKTEFDMPQRSN